MKKKMRCFTACALAASVLIASGCSIFGGEYVVRYAHDGIHEIKVETGKNFYISELPQKTGYSFDGMWDASEGGSKVLDENGMSLAPYSLKSDSVLYPRFSPIEYTIMLDYAGAETSVRALTVEYDAEIEGLPTDLKMEGKEFSGWYTGRDGEGEQVADARGIFLDKKKLTASEYPVAEATDNKIYLYAYFTDKTYTVTFSYEQYGSSDLQEKAVAGTSLAQIMPVRTVGGKVVIAWSTRQNDSTLESVFNGTIEGDMTLYPAKWGYIINFNSLGGEPLPPVCAEEGSAISLPVPVKENNRFLYWERNGGEYTNNVMPAESFTLTAKWQPLVTFAEYDGIKVDSIGAAVGQEVSLPDPSRDGYSFAGWYTMSGEAVNAPFLMPADGIRLKAGWYRECEEKFTFDAKDFSSEWSGIIREITLQNVSAQKEIYVSIYAKFDIKVKSHWLPGSKPHWFSVGFYNKSISSHNGEYMISEASKEWNSTETVSYDAYTGSGYTKGNKIYIGIRSNTWISGYTIGNFTVRVSYTDTSEIVF